MICGQQTFIPDIQQHRFCTLPLEPGENQNHDMPNQENKIRPHRSGEWTWANRYPEIGPEKFHEENTCWDCDEPFPDWQMDNVIPFDASREEIAAGESYECTKCKRLYSTIECRKEYTT